MELETFAAHLKALERRTGRTPEQRKKHPEAIPVDIDLITWDRETLKPRDITRPYLIEGLRELGEPLLPRGITPPSLSPKTLQSAHSPLPARRILKVKATSTGHRAK